MYYKEQDYISSGEEGWIPMGKRLLERNTIEAQPASQSASRGTTVTHMRPRDTKYD